MPLNASAGPEVPPSRPAITPTTSHPKNSDLDEIKQEARLPPGGLGVLDAEFMACARPTRATHQALADAGVEIGAYELFQLVGIALIRLVDHGLFDFDPSGKPAFITPVRSLGGAEFEDIHHRDVVLVGDAVDLVAWHPAVRNRWALRTGNARVLGRVEPQTFMPPPVPVARDVLGWLQNGRRGLVLLTDDQRERGEILRSLDVVVAEDDQHRAELRRLASRPWPAPSIICERAPQRRAA